MKSQVVTVPVALLALCCLLIPRGGESAGGIVSLRQTEEERQAGDQLRDESLDDTESEGGLVADPLPQESSIKTKRDTETKQAGKRKKNQLLAFKVQMCYVDKISELLRYCLSYDMTWKSKHRHKATVIRPLTAPTGVTKSMRSPVHSCFSTQGSRSDELV